MNRRVRISYVKQVNTPRLVNPTRPAHAVAPPSANNSYVFKHPPRNIPKLSMSKPQEPHCSCAPRSSHRRKVKSNLCVICHSTKAHSDIISLPCGHQVHASCFQSYENFNRSDQKCPNCYVSYTSIDIRKLFEKRRKAALRIQCLFRGYLVRHSLIDVTPVDSHIHRRKMISRAQHASNKLVSAIENQSDTVDCILASIDKELDWAREVMKQVEVRESVINWNAIRDKVLQMEHPECMICLREIDPSECTITSCSHPFHTQCLQNWIQFCTKEKHQATCPECRSAFQYQELIPKRTSTALAMALLDEGVISRMKRHSEIVGISAY